MEIQDKVTIITGASEGIGLATARLLASKGAKVVLAARSIDKLTRLADELTLEGYQAFALRADIRDKGQVEQMIEAAFEHYGRLDILINNAGQAAAGTVATLNLDDYRQIIELNIFGVLYAMQAAIPKMRLAGGGLILNISSGVSKMNIPGLSGYASTKAALNMLSATARGELAGENIRVVTVLPRLTATDFGKNSIGDKEMRQRQRPAIPTNTVVDSAEHVAGKILEAIQNEPAEQYMTD